MKRHPSLNWADLEAKLINENQKLWSLNEMEQSGGEPDVIGYNVETDEYLFVDCSAETPKGRRSFCYDMEALESRKTHKPANNAIDVATEMGIELLSEEDYRTLQQHGPFDQKKHLLGSRPQLQFARLAVHSFATIAMVRCLFIIMARHRTMRHGDSAVPLKYNLQKKNLTTILL